MKMSDLLSGVFARSSAMIGVVVLAMFVTVVLGCGSGIVSSPTMSHGQTSGCGSLFIEDFVVLQKDGSYLVALALFLIQGLFLANRAVNLVSFNVILSGLFSRLRILECEIIEKLNDVILRSFSTGILQPKVY